MKLILPEQYRVIVRDTRVSQKQNEFDCFARDAHEAQQLALERHPGYEVLSATQLVHGDYDAARPLRKWLLRYGEHALQFECDAQDIAHAVEQFHEVPRSDARHDHVLGMYERNVPAFSDEHVIGYAYPTSESAGKLGCGKSGCFYLQAKGRITAHKTINQALRAALELGTKPGLWSMDHPNHQMQSTTASKEACL